MTVSLKTQRKINNLFKTNPEFRERLFVCDAAAIREVGGLSQSKVEPEDIIEAYESNDKDTMNYLYKQAKRLVELKELYNDLCIEFYEKIEGNVEDNDSSISK